MFHRNSALAPNHRRVVVNLAGERGRVEFSFTDIHILSQAYTQTPFSCTSVIVGEKGLRTEYIHVIEILVRIVSAYAN